VGTEWGYLSNKTIWNDPIPLTAAITEVDSQFNTSIGCEFYRDILGNFTVEICDHTADHKDSANDTSLNIYEFSRMQDDWESIFKYRLVGICPPYFTPIDSASVLQLYSKYGFYYVLHSGDSGIANIYSKYLICLPNEEIIDSYKEEVSSFQFDLNDGLTRFLKCYKTFSITAMMIHPSSIITSYYNITMFFNYLMHDFPYRDQVWFTTASNCAYLWRAILGMYSEGSTVTGIFNGSTYVITINVGQSDYPIHGLPLSISNGTIASVKLNEQPIYTFFNKSIVLYGLQPNTEYTLIIETGMPYTPTIVSPLGLRNFTYIQAGEFCNFSSQAWDVTTMKFRNSFSGTSGLNVSVKYYIPTGNIFDNNLLFECNQSASKWSGIWSPSDKVLTVEVILDSSPEVTITLTRLRGNLQVYVKDSQHNPISDAVVVSITQPPDQNILNGTTDSAGQVTFNDKFTSYNSGYLIKASKSGYKDANISTTVFPNQTNSITILLEVEEQDQSTNGSNLLFYILISLPVIVIIVALLLFFRNRRKKRGI
jgi:hypothetical protein